MYDMSSIEKEKQPLRNVAGILPMPSPISKGRLVSKMLFAEETTGKSFVVVGPTAKDIDPNTEDLSSPTNECKEALKETLEGFFPVFKTLPIVGHIGGSRAATDSVFQSEPNCLLTASDSCWICGSISQVQYVHTAAIRSTGLTAAMGIGCWVVRRIQREHPTLVSRLQSPLLLQKEVERQATNKDLAFNWRRFYSHFLSSSSSSFPVFRYSPFLSSVGLTHLRPRLVWSPSSLPHASL